MKTVLILALLPLLLFPSPFSRRILQISAYLRLPGRLCLHHLWLAGPVRGHAADGVVAVGRGAAAQAGRAVLG